MRERPVLMARQRATERRTFLARQVSAMTPSTATAMNSPDMRGLPSCTDKRQRGEIMTATYTFDVFSTLDGHGSYTGEGDWGGYWGKAGQEFLDRRVALYEAAPRMVLGATTFREFLEVLGSASAPSGVDDPVNTR